MILEYLVCLHRQALIHAAALALRSLIFLEKPPPEGYARKINVWDPQGMGEVREYLDRFNEIANKCPGTAPWSFRFEGGQHQKHILFGGITHGNEVGSLPSLVQLAENLISQQTKFGGIITIMLGNVEACLADKRFIEADLNRVFLDSAPKSLEKSRAKELMSLFDGIDLFIDFHQTIEPSESPFFIFPFHLAGYHWARLAAGGLRLVTRDPAREFAKGQVCADEYARSLGVPGITIEMGQKGLTELSAGLTSQCCHRAMFAMDEIARGETIDKLVKSEDSSELEFFEIQSAQTFDSEYMRLDPGLKNFSRVKAGQVIGQADRAGAPLKANMDGYLLFPKYPRRSDSHAALGPYPSEIYNLAVPMKEHPLRVYKNG